MRTYPKKISPQRLCCNEIISKQNLGKKNKKSIDKREKVSYDKDKP